LIGRRGFIPGAQSGCIIPGPGRKRLTMMIVQAFYRLLASAIIIIVAV